MHSIKCIQEIRSNARSKENHKGMTPVICVLHRMETNYFNYRNQTECIWFSNRCLLVTFQSLHVDEGCRIYQRAARLKVWLAGFVSERQPHIFHMLCCVSTAHHLFYTKLLVQQTSGWKTQSGTTAWCPDGASPLHPRRVLTLLHVCSPLA